MATKLPAVDVVLVGFGWTASIVGQELAAAGLKVLALERGKFRDTVPDFATTHVQDELKYAVRDRNIEAPVRETLTFRNSMDQTALPMRHIGSFRPASGVGGAGVHWNGQCWRFLPEAFKVKSHTIERYGKNFIPDDMTIQDWGVGYEQLEPYYDKFEYLCGVSGQAGNLMGAVQPGGNPFEGPRSRPYPLPPLKRSAGTALFEKAAGEVGMHPFPCPAANTSEPYLNPLGVQMGKCTYCGYCEWFGCGNYSKASPQSTILPVLLKQPNFSYKTGCDVTRVLLDKSGKRATGVLYVDYQGKEFEQPASEMVVLCAFAYHNPHLMLVSGIGKPYDPQANTGVVGRNYAYQITSSVEVFVDEIMNPFMGAGALGQGVDDFNGDNFDHAPHGFIGGGYIALWTTGGRPILQHHLPESAPKWGEGWKKAMAENYLRSFSIATHGSVMSYRNSYLDLDPTYRDVYGNPLLRMTFDFHDNEHRMSRFLTAQAKRIAEAMKHRSLKVNERSGHYSIVPYQTTHNTGGTAMGDDPNTSVVNKYLQSWDVPNLFVMGASVFPQNHGYNPTGTIGALTYWAVDAMKNIYLKNPGPMVRV